MMEVTSVLLRRCAVCVGSPAPADLPELPAEHDFTFRPMVHLASGRDTLPLDFKLAAAGREPGEEG